MYLSKVNEINLSKAYFCAVISNPVRYWSRAELFVQFQEHVERAGANLMVVEAAFGDRPYVVTDPENRLHLQFRTYEELWHKENMINLAIARLNRIDPDWEYFGWIDGDIHFVRSDWVNETVQQLQHYMVVQMWSEAIDMTPNFEVMAKYKSFGWCWHENRFEPDAGIVSSGHYYGGAGAKYYWHPGFAWAARREALEMMGTMAGGPLIDYPCIIGAADHHMALAMIGKADKSFPPKVHPNYKKAIHQWEERALKYLKKDIGYVPGIINHHFHGNKKDRKYWGRWEALIDNKFDPETDLRRDSQGLFQLVVEDERQRRLRDAFRAYYRSRNEDSIDVDWSSIATKDFRMAGQHFEKNQRKEKKR